MTCEEHCPDGYVVSPEGCPTCKCLGPDAEGGSLDCPPLDCDVECPDTGLQLDETGCPLCQCADSESSYVETDPEDQCPEFQCELECEFGFRVDDNGCLICLCKPPPCATAMCANYCPGGYVYDDQECMTCDCVEETVVPQGKIDH